jgi:hypothetical protein
MAATPAVTTAIEQTCPWPPPTFRSASVLRAGRRSSAPSRTSVRPERRPSGRSTGRLRRREPQPNAKRRGSSAWRKPPAWRRRPIPRRGGSIRFWASIARRRVRRAPRPRSSNRRRGKRNATRHAPGRCARRLIRSRRRRTGSMRNSANMPRLPGAARSPPPSRPPPKHLPGSALSKPRRRSGAWAGQAVSPATSSSRCNTPSMTSWRRSRPACRL